MMVIDLAPPSQVVVPVAMYYDKASNELGNNGYIVGKVTEVGVAVSRRVLLYSRRSGILLKVTRSDALGNYRFNGLNLRSKYFVVSIDENGDSQQYNAVIQDLIAANEVIK